MADLPEGWDLRGRPPALFRRFEFARYADTRKFLDALAALSDETGIHPQNVNFGTTYANVTLEGPQGGEPGPDEYALAARIGVLPGPLDG